MTPQEAATQLIDAITELDGVKPENIRAIRLDPTFIEFETYQLDADGKKFAVNGMASTATRKLPYRYDAPDERDYRDADLSLLYGEHTTPIEIKWRPDQSTRPTNEPLTPDNHTGIKR